MTITISVDHDKQLTDIKVVGTLSFNEALDTLHDFYQKSPTKNLLWDFSDASFDNISSWNLKKLTDYVKQYGHLRIGGKTALVAPNDLERGLLQMLEIRLLEAFDETDEIPIRLEISRSVDEAISWLDKE
jgi:hypothetical protein